METSFSTWLIGIPPNLGKEIECKPFNHSEHATMVENLEIDLTYPFTKSRTVLGTQQTLSIYLVK